MSKKMTRRDFLKVAGMAGGAAVAASVVGAVPALAANSADAGLKLGFPYIQKKEFEGVTVRMHAISGANYDELYKLIPQWEETTGGKVEFVFKGNGFETDKRLVQDLAAGTVDYDLAWDHSSFFSQYIKADGLEPLETYFSEDDLKDFIPRMVETVQRDGHLWLIPRHYDISCMHYRTDLLGDQAPPETWDQFKEMALALTDASQGIYGTQFTGKEEALSGRFYEVLFSEGGALFNDKWEPTFNSEAGVKAATMFADLYAAGAMPPDMTNFLWEDVAKNWANGIIAMYTEWYGWYSFFQDPANSKVASKFDLARQPKGTLPGAVHGGWAGIHGFSIPKAAKQKEAAASLIKHLTSVEGNQLEAKLGFLVVRQSVWDEMIAESEKSTDPLAKKRLELALLQGQEDLRTPPLIAEWLPVSNVLYPMVQQIILGDVDAQTGLDDAAKQVWDLMDKAGYYKAAG